MQFNRYAVLFSIGLAGITSCASSGSDKAGFIEEETIEIPDTVASPEVANLHNPLPGLPLPLRLAGNFGELRNNHFHSGIDFKTGGREGAKVVSADSGYVSRVVVSPWGFGRAVYVTHPRTGLTTVYGHLRAFAPKIDSLVRAEQYRRETFSIDLEFEPDRIVLARGEKLGDSGNAGSSGGPHLHMDVRQTSTGDALDPMPYYMGVLDDKVRPELRTIALYAVENEGTVQGKARFDAATKPYTFTAWGKVYPGIKAYDRMTDTQNIYGVKYLTLFVDGEEVFKRTVDRFSFDDTRAVHTLVHFPTLKRSGEWIMTTRVPATEPLSEMIEATNNGVIDIDEARDYRCEFILEDEMGNRTSVPFTIRGREADTTMPAPEGKILVKAGQRHTSSKEGASIEIPANALYDDAFFDINVSAAPAEGYLSRTYTFGSEETPLHRSVRISVPVNPSYDGDPRKLTLVRLRGKGRSAVGARYENGCMVADVTNLGRYAVTTDTKAPSIVKGSKSANRISYKISDNLSGIDTYRGEIDGQFALMELDGKTGTLSFVMDRSRFPKTGKPKNVTIRVTDAAGNETVLNDTADGPVAKAAPKKRTGKKSTARKRSASKKKRR